MQNEQPEMPVSARQRTPAPPADARIDDIANHLRTRLEERFTPCPRVTVDGRSITVERRTREYQVHRRDRFGQWSTSTYPVVGPQPGGVHLLAHISSEPCSEPLPRPAVTLPQIDQPDAEIGFLGARLREPYFDLYVSKTEFQNEQGSMWVNVAVGDGPAGSGPPKWIVWIHRRLLESCGAHGLVAAEPPAVDLPDALMDPHRAEQDRCDAFYRLFGVHEPHPIVTPPLPPQLQGLTTLRIAALLGPPQRIERQEFRGEEWLRIWYEFSVCPRDAPEALQDRFDDGWRYRVPLYFRNRCLVAPGEFEEAWGLKRRALIPLNLGFSPSDEFP